MFMTKTWGCSWSWIITTSRVESSQKATAASGVTLCVCMNVSISPSLYSLYDVKWYAWESKAKCGSESDCWEWACLSTRKGFKCCLSHKQQDSAMTHRQTNREQRAPLSHFKFEAQISIRRPSNASFFFVLFFNHPFFRPLGHGWWNLPLSSCNWQHLYRFAYCSSNELALEDPVNRHNESNELASRKVFNLLAEKVECKVTWIFDGESYTMNYKYRVGVASITFGALPWNVIIGLFGPKFIFILYFSSQSFEEKCWN